ncbi:MAG: GerW family sporulation protein [Oscillospiraceae bacterium]|nr:GerW family sporulation protein [Oscillospiraceae bacterium]
MDDKVKDLVRTSLDKVKELSDADTIIGDPIKLDGVTIIPVSKVSYGFAAGGSDLPSKSSSELFGGGTGGGVTIQPIAFIVVANGDVKLLQINQDKSSTGAIVNLVPELFDKVQGLFSKKKADDEPLGVTPDINTEGLNLSLDDEPETSDNSKKSNSSSEFDF